MNMQDDSAFFLDTDIATTTVEPGLLSRKVRATGGKMMMVEVFFAKGACGAAHRHEHEQLCYCLSGTFGFSVGDVHRTLHSGDSVHIPPNELHGAVCIEEGRLLDIFTPQRTDFL